MVIEQVLVVEIKMEKVYFQFYERKVDRLIDFSHTSFEPNKD